MAIRTQSFLAVNYEIKYMDECVQLEDDTMRHHVLTLQTSADKPQLS